MHAAGLIELHMMSDAPGARSLNNRRISHIRFEERINYHRDYYDLGEMLYEHIPLYGWFTRQLKTRLAG